MRDLERLGELKPHYIIITGDGLFDRRVLKGFCGKYNGNDIILWIANEGFLNKTGLNVLNALKVIPGNYKINSVICILDGDSFRDNPGRDEQIRKHLDSISINIDELTPIQDSFLIRCSFGSHKILLYVIISGPSFFIEEEIVQLLKITGVIDIDLSGKRDQEWKSRIKKNVRQTLRSNDIKLEKFIPTITRRKLEASFLNMCAIFKKIEEEHQN